MVKGQSTYIFSRPTMLRDWPTARASSAEQGTHGHSGVFDIIVQKTPDLEAQLRLVHNKQL